MTATDLIVHKQHLDRTQLVEPNIAPADLEPGQVLLTVEEFAPDVAEARAADIGHDAYHAEFAAAWEPFATWASGFTAIERSAGPEAIRVAYLSALGGAHDPSTGTRLAFS